MNVETVHTKGKRKSSIATCRLMVAKKTTVEINGHPASEYFSGNNGDNINLNEVLKPLIAAEGQLYKVILKIKGGGRTGQSGAALLAIARALVAINPDNRSLLKPLGYLTSDGRKVERKKCGLRKARARTQWKKR